MLNATVMTGPSLLSSFLRSSLSPSYFFLSLISSLTFNPPPLGEIACQEMLISMRSCPNIRRSPLVDTCSTPLCLVSSF